MTDVFIKRGDLETDTHTRRIPCEHEDRDQSDACISQGILKMASKPSRVRRKAWNRFFFIDLRRNQTCWYLDLGLQPLELWDNTFLFFYATELVILCYGSISKLVQILRNIFLPQMQSGNSDELKMNATDKCLARLKTAERSFTIKTFPSLQSW